MKLLKKLLKVLGVLLALILVAALFINFRGIPSYEVNLPDYNHSDGEYDIDRGRVLAMTLCVSCHGNQETQRFSGKQMVDVPAEFGVIYAPNITQDKTHGIGNYSDSELLYLLRTGIKKDGVYAPPYMPKFPLLSDFDMNSIIAFLRSDSKWVQADDTPSSESEITFLTKFLATIAFKPLPYPDGEIAGPDTTDQVAWGKYLVHNLDCYSCHSADYKTNDYLNPEMSVGYLGGGNKPLNLKGEIVVTPNISSDKETGIGNWTAEEFYRAVKSGQKDGEPALRYPMIPYTLLSDEEVNAMYAYLMSSPPISNKIERSNLSE